MCNEFLQINRKKMNNLRENGQKHVRVIYQSTKANKQIKK